MGSLAAVTRSRVWFPVPVVLVCCAAIFALHRQALLLSIEEGGPGCSACGWARCACCC